MTSIPFCRDCGVYYVFRPVKCGSPWFCPCCEALDCIGEEQHGPTCTCPSTAPWQVQAIADARARIPSPAARSKSANAAPVAFLPGDPRLWPRWTEQWSREVKLTASDFQRKLKASQPGLWELLTGEAETAAKSER